MYSVCASLQVYISRFENDTSPITSKFNQLTNVESGRKNWLSFFLMSAS